MHGIAHLQDRYSTIIEILADRYEFHMRVQGDKKESWEPGSLNEYDSNHLMFMTDALYEHVLEFFEAYMKSHKRFENQYFRLFKEKGPLVYSRT